jgi:Glycosyltransferase family 87
MTQSASSRMIQPIAGLIRRHHVAVIALGAMLLLGFGALWMQWLVAEVSSAPARQGHHDFFAFYAAGTLVRGHQAGLLYSAGTLTGIERRILDAPVGAAGYMPFLNPPAAAAVIAPLAALGEQSARVVWLVVTVLLAIACVLVATAAARPWLRALAVVLLLTSYPAFQTFVEGQWSFLLLLGCLGSLVAARRGHPVIAGIAIAVLWLKPPLLLLVLVWLLLARRWRIAAAAVVTVATVSAVALPWTGLGSNAGYVTFLGGVTVSHATGAGALSATQWEGGLLGMEGLLGLAATIAGQDHAALVDALTIVVSLALVSFFLFAMRGRLHSGNPTARGGMAAVCLALVLDPHLYSQDCVLIMLVLALALREARSASSQAALIVATTAVMDLAALDTLWTSGMPLRPPHLLTLVLIAGVVVFARPTRALIERRPAASAIYAGTAAR